MFTLKVTSTRKCFRSCAGEERLAAFVSIVKKFFHFSKIFLRMNTQVVFEVIAMEAYRVHIN